MRPGITQVMEGRRIFAELTVEENLRLGAHTRPRGIAAALDRVFGLFPVLAQRGGASPATCPAASSRWWRWAGR